MSRDSKFKYFMHNSTGTRAERRRVARELYRASKSPYGIRPSSQGNSRALERTRKPLDGSEKRLRGSKYQTKQISMRNYLKGWFTHDKSLYTTDLSKNERKDKEYTEVQRLRKKQFNLERKRAILAGNF